MAAVPDYTVPSTGLGWSIAVRPYVAPVVPPVTNTTAYTPAALVTKITPPSRSIDKADATLLSSTIKKANPTLPEGQVSFTMFAAEADPAYVLMDASCKQALVQWLDFLMTNPLGATKQVSGWISEWKPSDLTTGENRSIDITIEQQTVTVYTAPPPTS